MDRYSIAQINPGIPPEPPPEVPDTGINPRIPPPAPTTQVDSGIQQIPQNPATGGTVKNEGWIILAIVLGSIFLLSLVRRRENARHNLRFMITAGIIGFIVFIFASADPAYQAAAVIIAVLTGVVVFVMRPSRRRRIPQSVRRRKIAKWELKTGKKFNSRKYEIDHIVPFSKGGSHTPDNLQVLEKRENRSKGSRAPWWDIFRLWQ